MSERWELGMPHHAKKDLTAPEVLSRVRAELDLAHPSASPLDRRIARIRTMQRDFR